MHDRKIISSKAAIPVLANPSIAQPNGHITTTHLALDMTLAHFQIPIELRIIIKFYFHQAIEKNEDIYESVRCWMVSRSIAVTRYGPISYWDTEGITSMRELFYARNYIFNRDDHLSDEEITLAASLRLFNDSLQHWNVSRVKDMTSMFEGALSFNQNLSSWNTSSAIQMKRMFYHAKSYNGSLHGWNVKSVQDMEEMFAHAESFNQPLNKWETTSTTNMCGMFKGAKSFNQDLRCWDVSSVNNCQDMFYGASSFCSKCCFLNFLPNFGCSSEDKCVEQQLENLENI